MCVSGFWPWLPNLCAFVIFHWRPYNNNTQIWPMRCQHTTSSSLTACSLPGSACCMQRTQSSDKLIALSDSPTRSYQLQLQSPAPAPSQRQLGPACLCLGLVRNETNICAIANANFPI